MKSPNYRHYGNRTSAAQEAQKDAISADIVAAIEQMQGIRARALWRTREPLVMEHVLFEYAPSIPPILDTTMKAYNITVGYDYGFYHDSKPRDYSHLAHREGDLTFAWRGYQVRQEWLGWWREGRLFWGDREAARRSQPLPPWYDGKRTAETMPLPEEKPALVLVTAEKCPNVYERNWRNAQLVAGVSWTPPELWARAA